MKAHSGEQDTAKPSRPNDRECVGLLLKPLESSFQRVDQRQGSLGPILEPPEVGILYLSLCPWRDFNSPHYA